MSFSLRGCNEGGVEMRDILKTGKTDKKDISLLVHRKGKSLCRQSYEDDYIYIACMPCMNKKYTTLTHVIVEHGDSSLIF